MKAMRRLTFLFLICIIPLLCSELRAKDDSCFSLANIKGYITDKKSVNKTFSQNSSFYPFKSNGIISGLSLDVEITRESSDYLVRILLKDRDGAEYLVLEAYNELFDEDKIILSDYGEETLLLNGIRPDSISVFVRNATVIIKNITTALPNSLQTGKIYTKETEALKEHQAKAKAQRINNYNQRHKKLWTAGVSSLSKKNYETKKRILNMANDGNTGGYDYYIGGIFEVGNITSSKSSKTRTSSPYVDEFDWRYRHGKPDNYWVTSIKDQYGSSFCLFFSIVGCTESLANLYYNTNLNLDLSEMELAWCSGVSAPYHGVSPGESELPFDYLVNHGICSENSYHFIDTPNDSCRSENINTNELVKASGYYHANADENIIKYLLINGGPMSAGIHANGIWHAMVLVGYGVIKQGDVINTFVNNYTIQEEDSLLIGRTYWIFKDSSFDYITHYPTDGYVYVIFENCSQMGEIYSILTPIIIPGYTSANIVCEDNDGDGYYNWGIGPKPSNCPSWVLDIEDGDDSDINSGSLNMFGYLEELPPGKTIKTPVVYATNDSTPYRLGIVNGGVLTISGTTTLTGNSKIRVCEGGILIVDGGTLQNADITMVPGSTLIIRNNGVINMASGKEFIAPVGTIVNIESGEIN